jgi:hypothetical protein
MNMGKNLQAALEQAAHSRKGPQTLALVPAKPVPVAAEPAAPSAKAPSRAGKVHIGAYLGPDFKKSLLLVRAATGKTEQDLIAQALNELFRAHDVPVVDHE